MKHTTRLKYLIERPEILVMPGAFDPMSAKLIERAGFEAVQCTGLGITANYLGLPDYSVLGMSDVVGRTAAIVRAVDLPVMADADTGFGNAVNVWYTVRCIEAAGAAGLNLEDQYIPKRCGHLEGKEVISIEEMIGKLRAAVDARKDPDFVINARTDSLAVYGLEEAIRRGNAYLEAGATMVFIDGVNDRDTIRSLAKRIKGPVGINMVEGGKTPHDLTFTELEAMGIARVSLPLTAFLGALRGMEKALAEVRMRGSFVADPSVVFGFSDAHELVGMDQVYELERRFLPEQTLAAKYSRQDRQARVPK